MTGLTNVNATWWAKVEQAREHRARLRVLYDEYRARQPVDVHAEDPDAEGWVSHRLSIAEPVPSTVPLIVGDILHNLRSALDSLVFGMASQEAENGLTEREERACNLPICDTPASFEAAYAKIARIIKSDRLKPVLQRAQPHYWHARYYAHIYELGDQSFDMQTDGYIDASKSSPLWSLNQMNNIDKHRRLAVVAWWPEHFYWMSDTEDQRQEFRIGPGPFEDGGIVASTRAIDDSELQPLISRFQVILADAPDHRDSLSGTDMMSTVDGWISGTVRALEAMIVSWEQPDADPGLVVYQQQEPSI